MLRNLAGRLGLIDLAPGTGAHSDAASSCNGNHGDGKCRNTGKAAWKGAGNAAPATPLLDAVRCADSVQVRRLMAHNPSLARETDSAGNTALHIAAQARHYQGHGDNEKTYENIADFLLASNADPDAGNRAGETPLHHAALLGRSPLLLALLLRHANPAAVDHAGNTVLHLIAAAEPMAAEMLDELVKSGQPLPLQARNDAGDRPVDVARQKRQPEAFLHRLEELAKQPVAHDALNALNAPSAPDSSLQQPWLHLFDKLGRAMEAPGGPACCPAIWPQLCTLIKAWPQVDSIGHEGRTRAGILAIFTRLIALSSGEAIADAIQALRCLKEAGPEFESTHAAQACGLHEAIARLLLQDRKLAEAAAYASHALALARALPDAPLAKRLAQMLDDIEIRFIRACLREDCEEGGSGDAPGALAWWERKLASLHPGSPSSPQLAAFLAEVTRLLDTATEKANMLAGCGLVPAARRLGQLGNRLDASALAETIGNRLQVLAVSPDKDSEMNVIADAVPALAMALARHGASAAAKACCAHVTSAAAKRAAQPDLPPLCCDRHAGLENGGLDSLDKLIRPLRESCHWEGLRARLASLRASVRADILALPLPAAWAPGLREWRQPLAVEALQERITAGYAQLIDDVARRSIASMLVPQPCRFALIGLGSFSRRDMGLYSDLEYAVLVDGAALADPDNLRWLYGFTRRFDFHVRMLGETHPGGDHPLDDPRGFHIDPAIAAQARQRSLVVSRESIVGELRGQAACSARTQWPTDQGFAFSLLTPALAWGDADLLRDYRKALHPTEKGQVERWRPDLGDIVLRQIHADVGHFRTGLVERGQIDVKQQLIRPLVCALTELTLLNGCTATDTSSMLRQLGTMQAPLAPAFVADLRWALATAHTIQLRHQLRLEGAPGPIERDMLSAEERSALDDIERRVVEPLWQLMAHWVRQRHDWTESAPAVLATIRQSENIEPALLPFAPPDEVCASDAVLRPFDDRQVDCLAQTLAHRHLPEASLKHYYRLSFARCAPSHYPSRWQRWRSAFERVPDGAARLKTLALVPMPRGWRGGWHESEQAFLRRLDSWFCGPAPLASRLHAQLVDPRTSAVVRLTLRPEVVDALVTSAGDIRPKPQDQGGRHTLLPVTLGNAGLGTKWWVKVHPENAPMDWLVHALERRITGGHGTLTSRLMVLQCKDGRVPLQVFEHVEGESLAVVVRDQPQLLSSISPSSFTRTLLRVLLTNPEDDKDDDYFLCPDDNGQLQLRRIDNERAFFPAEESNLLRGNRLQVKSMLYCLDQMHEALDGEALSELLTLSAPQLVNAWLQEAHVLHGHYRALFDDAEVEENFRRELPCLLTVGIASGLERHLLDRLEAIQKIVQLARKDNSAITGMDLLTRLHNAIAAYYAAAFQRFPIAADQPGAAAERFRWLTRDSYTMTHDGVRRTSMAGATAITRGLDLQAAPRRADLCDIAAARRLSPCQALQRLDQLTVSRVDAITEGVLAGVEDDVRHFNTLSVRQRTAIFNTITEKIRRNASHYKLEGLRRVLRAVAGVPFIELALSPYAEVLNDALLMPIIRASANSLWRLDLGGCHQVTIDALCEIAQCCRGLRRLHLRRMHDGGDSPAAALSVLRKPWLSFGTLSFPMLQRLDLADNSHLVQIEIDAPVLRELSLRNCTRLTQVRTGKPQLRRVDARGCTALTGAALAGITSQWLWADEIRLDEGFGVTHRALRERHPWLMAEPFEDWSDRGAEKLAAAISRALRGSGGRAPMHFRERILNWLEQRRRLALREVLVDGPPLLPVPEYMRAVAVAFELQPVPILEQLGWQSGPELARFARVRSGGPKEGETPTIGDPLADFPEALDFPDDPGPAVSPATISHPLDVQTPYDPEALAAIAQPMLQAAEDQLETILPTLQAFWSRSDQLGKVALDVIAGSVPRHRDHAVDALVMAMSASRRSVRRMAVAALLRVAAAHPAIIAPSLLRWRTSGDRLASCAASAALCTIASDVPVISLLHSLVDGLNTGGAIAREIAVRALGRLAQQGYPDTIPHIVEALNDGSAYVRFAAIQSACLNADRLSADEASGVLALRFDRNVAIRAAVIAGANHLQQLPMSDLLFALRLAAHDASPRVRTATAVACTSLPADRSESAVCLLLPLLHDADPGCRRAAAAALALVPPTAPQGILRGLLCALRDADETAKLAAIRTLGRLGAGLLDDISALDPQSPEYRSARLLALGIPSPQVLHVWLQHGSDAQAPRR
ncbi:putative nucleotidyltransferase substrate binding domain-containing protein [Paracidovorax citrulli]